MEFILMIGMAIIVILAFLAAIYSMASHYSEQKNLERLTALGYSLQNELILASEVEPGYQRIIFIPGDAVSAPYEITHSSQDLIINYRGSDLLFRIPAVTGSFEKGRDNTIRRIGADIIIT